MAQGLKTIGSLLGVYGLFALTIIILKFLEVINWSWLWATAPIWIPIGGGSLLLILVVFGYFLYNIFGK